MNPPVARNWFTVERISDGLLLLREPNVDPLLRCNIWLVRGRDRDLMVDTGLGVASLRAELAELSDRPIITVATHTHYDHVGSMHEFEERVVHRAESRPLSAGGDSTLIRDSLGHQAIAMLRAAGYPLETEELITAYPASDYDPRCFSTIQAAPTRLVEEGDTIDLGDRAFTVLHLPGHTPGSIGLWERPSGTLFAGDAIYDGPLLDELPESSIPDYLTTMRRLVDLPVEVVHAGHDPSFERGRLRELTTAYLRRREGRG